MISIGLLGVVVIAVGLLIGPSGRPPVSASAPAPAPTTAAETDVSTEESDPEPEPADEDRGTDITTLVSATWVEELAASTGIPHRALLAYTGASVAVDQYYPGCGLGWNTLAGIGHVESDHGRIHGSALDASGVARPAIVGIPLTGETTASIPDTDGGALDGDAVWDRAVGPMQFIPGTWREWATDGDGDGVADPQNVDDASLAAARYLCAIGGDLTDPERWIAAVAGYNDTVEYNNRVADAASFYASHS
ncbi:hypothetical protein ELQ94_03190 [Labedella endophytica]|uniref:Transglycosylase SLT domain-containing protein n=2 Tax=Labedella endophytica TaxID=1523160 RepID=A0A433JXM2_9MICO|nr:hypothetical protein ELQ94_03190 [Labedella endophytica]